MQKNPLLAALNEATLHEVQTQALVRRFERGDVVLNQGTRPTALYVVLRGRAKICRHTDAGGEAITQLIGPGETLLESVALQNHPSPVTVQAQTRTELMALPLPLVRRLLAEDPAFSAAYVEILCQRNNQLMHLVEQVAAHPAEDRVAAFLLATMLDGGVPSQEFELPCKKAEIARHLGLAAETFSRCLQALAKKGIKVSGRKVKLEHRDSLCAYCDPLQGRRCSDRNKLRCHMFGL